MARLSDTIVYGNHSTTGNASIGGTLTINGVVYQQVNLSGGTNVTVSGTYPNLTISSVNTNTTYSAGTGLSLSGTTFNVTSPFNSTGTYSGLRAQATTKADVGLGNVLNVASYSKVESDGRYLTSAPATNLSVSTTTTTNTVASSTGTDATLPAATTSKAGVMSVADKTKLNGIAAGAQVNVGTNLGYTASTRVLTSSTGTNVTLPEATTSNPGLMSASDKTKLDSSASGAVPSGAIVMWSGSIVSIPAGWALCNGQNGTPNLVDRFVVGAGSSYAVDATGGSADAVVVSHSHSASTVSAGSHNHSGTTNKTGSHTHSVPMYAGGGAYGRPLNQGGANTASSSTGEAGDHSHTLSIYSNGSHTHTVIVDSAGESGTNKNLPPYYALAFIMKL